MNVTITFISGGPHKFFGQNLAAGTITVPELHLQMAKLGIGAFAQDYNNLEVAVDRGLVSVTIRGAVYATTVGLAAAVDNGSDVQTGTGTLAAGTFTVATGITVTAQSKIILTPATRPTVTTNLATIGVVARTVGAPGVGAFTVEALLATGLIDNDAVGTVNWMIVN